MLRSAFLQLLICTVAVALPATHADAQSTSTAIAKPKSPAALDHLAKGNNLYNVRSFAEAAAEYKAGALVETAPIFDYNLGQCYRQLGKYEDAIWHYRRFIKTSPGATDNIAAASNFITQMQDELNKKAMSAPPTEAAPATSPPPTPEPEPDPTDRVPDKTLVESAPWYHDRLGLSLTVLGLVGTGVATVLLVNARSLTNDGDVSTSQRERDQLFDKADTRSKFGIGTMIGSGALLVTGIVMLAIPERRATRSSVSVGFHPTGFSIQGRF